MNGTYDIIIIGGGFSGLMVAANAVRLSPRRLRIGWWDDGGRFARGTAYQTAEDVHLLNVMADNMSAWRDDAEDFLAWLQNRHPHYGAADFAPRMIYGAYLDDIKTRMAAHAELQTYNARVTGAAYDGSMFSVQDDEGRTMKARALVLASGNPDCRDPGWPEDARFIRDFWRWRLGGGRLRESSGDDPVIILGTGLTTADAVLSLRDDGYKGLLWVVSPRGHWPLSHANMAGAPDVSALPAALEKETTALGYWRTFRRHVARDPQNWRAAVEAVRPAAQQLWHALPAPEKARFLRHALSYWNIHRHRMAPQIHKTLAQDARLKTIAGRVTDVTSEALVTIRPRGQTKTQTMRAAYVINCTGPSYRTLITDNPLLRDLQRQGLIAPGPLGLGMATPETPGLFTLGTPLIGEYLETTAVPRVRIQAAAVAEKILALL